MHTARNEVFDAFDQALEWSDLDPSQCPEGVVATGSARLVVAHGMAAGVWEHQAGTSTDVEADEVFVVLAGRGRVRLPDDRVMELRPGVVGVLAAGTHTVWEIDEALRKVWITSS